MQAGVSEQQLQDKSTREFLYSFVNTHGGRDAVVKGIKVDTANEAPPPAVPPRGPTRGSHFRNAPPPPLPQKSNSVMARRPKPMDIVPPKKPPPAPIPGSAPPAPPPPPPPPMEMPGQNDMSSMAPPPPPPPMTETINSALLQSIRNGTTLKVRYINRHKI